jgi:hypothetical protein
MLLNHARTYAHPPAETVVNIDKLGDGLKNHSAQPQ